MTAREPRERGFVAIEWVAAIALLLLPAVVLAATLPAWAERRHAATVAAREAARELQADWPGGTAAAAELVARYVAADHGIDPGAVDVQVLSPGSEPGGQITVAVTVPMSAISLGAAHVGAWTYRAVVSLRVDDYRSR